MAVVIDGVSVVIRNTTVEARFPGGIDAFERTCPTWALAELGRLDEAESTARQAVALDANSAPALGNLASVLLHLILKRICEACGQQVSGTRALWYRRLWAQSTGPGK
jgi:hypothetical protein